MLIELSLSELEQIRKLLSKGENPPPGVYLLAKKLDCVIAAARVKEGEKYIKEQAL